MSFHLESSYLLHSLTLYTLIIWKDHPAQLSTSNRDISQILDWSIQARRWALDGLRFREDSSRCSGLALERTSSPSDQEKETSHPAAMVSQFSVSSWSSASNNVLPWRGRKQWCLRQQGLMLDMLSTGLWFRLDSPWRSRLALEGTPSPSYPPVLCGNLQV